MSFFAYCFVGKTRASLILPPARGDSVAFRRNAMTSGRAVERFARGANCRLAARKPGMTWPLEQVWRQFGHEWLNQKESCNSHDRFLVIFREGCRALLDRSLRFGRI